MSAAVDTVGYNAVQPNTGLAATAIVGDSLTTKFAGPGAGPMIAAWWCKNQVAGFHQLTWPSGHDVTRGIRSRVPLGSVLPRYPRSWSPSLEPQELVSAFIAGSNVAGDQEIGVLQFYYPDLPGVSPRLIDEATLNSRGIRALTIEDTTGALTSVLWTGARALNAASDLLRANTDYAVVGYNLGVICAAIAIRGPDTGNLRIGVPGDTANGLVSERYFVDMTREMGVPYIPVFNSANKASTFTDCLQDENVTVVPFSWSLVELAPG